MIGDGARVSKIRIRQLRCFVAVARKKSFVLAAEELGLTQPAVSRSVRELEKIVGHDLFDRSTRGAELTQRGRALFESAESGLRRIAHGVALVVGGEALGGAVRIGALPNVCSQFLPAIIRDFKREHPSVAVRITPGTNADLLAALRRHETDLVIGRLSNSGDMRGLVFEALFDEPLVFVVGRRHPLADRSATLEEALAFPLLLPPEGTVIRQEISRYLAGQGVDRIPDLIETTSSDFQRAYLTASNCVAATPRGVVQSDLDAGVLVRLPFDEDALKGPVGLTTNPEMRPDAAVRQLIGRVRAAR